MEELQKLPYSSLGGALEYQSTVRPDKVAVIYPDKNKDCKEYVSLTYKQYNNLTNYIAEKLSKYMLNSKTDQPITCAILANGGINYLLFQYALLKLDNVIMFPISGRNSQLAIEHLLKETNTNILLTTKQYSSVCKIIRQEKKFESLQILFIDDQSFNIDHLLNNKDLTCSTLPSNHINNNKNQSFDKVIVILHSSGSTSYPKPIRLTNRFLVISHAVYMSLNKNFWTEADTFLAWGALFHLLAFNISVCAILAGATYALPLCVNFPPRPHELLANIQVNNGITILFTVPSLLEQLVNELLSENNKHIQLKPLQKLRFIMYGGAGCPDYLCKTLVENNIKLLSIYGSTETGIVLAKNFDPYDKRWNVMEIPNMRKKYIQIENYDVNLNENDKVLYHLSSDPFLAENIIKKSDDKYTTGDIFVEDPPNSGQYYILGRQDDILVHINGEKTNPIPMEDCIRHSPIVKHVAIVGHNQFCPALLVELNNEESSKYNLNEINEMIWNLVKQANKSAPSHSHIVKQLISILPSGKTLPITGKGNLIRRKVNDEYSTLINDLFEKFHSNKTNQNENSSKSTHLILNENELISYLHEKMNSILEKSNENDLNNDKSIFDLGINSLQIIQLRNFICQDICQIPINFLYEYSSISQITQQLILLKQPQKIDKEENDPFYYLLTENILNKHIDFIKSNSIEKTNLNKKDRVFLLTGANGSLASFIIQDLLNQPESKVKYVFCLIRGSNGKERLFQSYQQKELDTGILNKFIDKRLFIFSSMDLNQTNFGQTDSILNQFKTQVTDIVHLAWKMNFNQTIQHFEKDSILSLIHLLQFSASNSIQFHFISSISASGSGILNPVKEEPLPNNSQIALPQGYGQSKFIAEHLCAAAHQFWKIPVNIYRIGQISGNTKNGYWNPNELASMIIYAGAGKMKKMANLGEDINWIPINICSSVFIDLALKSSFDNNISMNERVYHLVNPHTMAYDQYLNALKNAGLDFKIVSPNEFYETIINSDDLNNPLIKLSSYFQQNSVNENALKIPTFQTEKTVEKCHILKTCPKVDSNLIKLYLNYWKQCQLF